MQYRRTPIEIESPEELGYDSIECNLSESSIWDARLGAWSADLDHLVLCYGEHRGSAQLRELIATSSGDVRAEDVLVVPGAAAALFIVNSSLLEANSSLLVIRPNYATNIGTPRLLRCCIQYLDLKFENGFELDLDEVAALLASETRSRQHYLPAQPNWRSSERGKTPRSGRTGGTPQMLLAC